MISSAIFIKKPILLLLMGGFYLPALRLHAADNPSTVSWKICADRIESSQYSIRAQGEVIFYNDKYRVEAGFVEASLQNKRAWASRGVAVMTENFWVTGGRIGFDWSGRSGRAVQFFDGIGDIPRKFLAHVPQWYER